MKLQNNITFLMICALTTSIASCGKVEPQPLLCGGKRGLSMAEPEHSPAYSFSLPLPYTFENGTVLRKEPLGRGHVLSLYDKDKLVTSFGNNGHIAIDFSLTVIEQQINGAILLIGMTNTKAPDWDVNYPRFLSMITVKRYLLSGQPDTAFGNKGTKEFSEAKYLEQSYITNSSIINDKEITLSVQKVVKEGRCGVTSCGCTSEEYEEEKITVPLD